VSVAAVVFDIGETLVDETRAWRVHAHRHGLTELTFFAGLGAVIARREDHRNVFQVLGVEPRLEPVPYEPEDLYPDVAECLSSLRREGYVPGLAGNQPTRTEAFLREAGFDVDLIAASETWGVTKPASAFFQRIVAEVGLEPAQIAYVGDRVDNDVVPAADAGMVPIFLRRGPWGYLQAGWPEVERARVRIDSLADLPEALRRV
jgi:FMN phosphatase YigB (HAD superfamily)